MTKVCPIMSRPLEHTTFGDVKAVYCIEAQCMAWVPEKVVPTLYREDGMRTIAAYCKLMEAHEGNME